MHEASLASSIIQIAQEEAQKAGCKNVISITVRIGKAAGVMIDALVFAFDALKQDTPLQNTTLKYEVVPVSGQCRECGKGFTANSSFVVSCPYCNSIDFAITAGRELQVVEIEAE